MSVCIVANGYFSKSVNSVQMSREMDARNVPLPPRIALVGAMFVGAMAVLAAHRATQAAQAAAEVPGAVAEALDHVAPPDSGHVAQPQVDNTAVIAPAVAAGTQFPDRYPGNPVWHESIAQRTGDPEHDWRAYLAIVPPGANQQTLRDMGHYPTAGHWVRMKYSTCTTCCAALERFVR